MSHKSPLERKIQRLLRLNIQQLEGGLKVVDGGKEQLIQYGGGAEPGRIDITAQDKKRVIVVIELKRGKAGRRAVGQILGYMGVLMQRRKPVRGILVAKKFSPQARAAASTVASLELRELRTLSLKSRTKAK